MSHSCYRSKCVYHPDLQYLINLMVIKNSYIEDHTILFCLKCCSEIHRISYSTVHTLNLSLCNSYQIDSDTSHLNKTVVEHAYSFTL